MLAYYSVLSAISCRFAGGAKIDRSCNVKTRGHEIAYTALDTDYPFHQPLHAVMQHQDDPGLNLWLST
jgi:hypothetical protein